MIYIYITYFSSLKYTIQNNTGWLSVIVLHLVNRLVRDRSDITKYTTSFWGQYRVFVIAIEKCKYGILKIRIMRFVVFHRYLYAWLIFLFNMQFRTIEDDCCLYSNIRSAGRWDIVKYYYYCWISITDFSCYLLFCFHYLKIYITKIWKNNT